MNTFSPVNLAGWVFPAFFGTGLVAGFVDSIAGGGGLITLPVILNVGLPPQLALGTNKFQASFGSGSAAWHYAQSGVVKFADCWLGALATAVGAAIGTVIVQHLNPEFLKSCIPVLLLVIAGYMIFKPQLGAADIHPRMRPAKFHLLAGLGLGFYDGFLGPGTGSFWTMAFMLGLGFNLTRATGHTKVMNFASNVVSLACFAAAGNVHYAAGLVMGAGQLLGAKAGARMVVTRGVKFVRPVFIAMVLALTLKLLYDALRRRF